MNNASPPLISIVIPVYNRLEYTRRCLETVQRLKYPNVETIVVDNASTDGTEAALRREYPHLTVLRNAANLGFAGGCNVGIRASRGPLIFLLNNDTKLIDPDVIDVLVRHMDERPRSAAVDPRLVDYEDPRIDLWDRKDLWRGAAAAMWGKTGAAAVLLRREALRQVGLFDPSMFAYGESEDLFARLKRAGWSLDHVDSTRVAHEGRGTSVHNSPFYLYWHSRNWVVLMRRYARPSDLVLKILPRQAYVTLWHLQNAVREKQWEAARAYLGGYRDGLRAALAPSPAVPFP